MALDLDQSLSDLSLDISDADPTELLDQINDIDELDAELFGPPKVPKPSQKGSQAPVKKVVSFQDPIKDALKESEKKKKEKTDEWLFADDGDSSGLLGDTDLSETKKGNNNEKLRVRSSIKSLMTPNSLDDILKKSTVTVKKKTLTDFASLDGVNTTGTSSDKVDLENSASPYSAKYAKPSRKSIDFDDEFGFGSYKPSVSSSSNVKSPASRIPSAGSESGNVEKSLTSRRQVHTEPLQPVSLLPPAQTGHKENMVPSNSTANTSSSTSSSGFSELNKPNVITAGNGSAMSRRQRTPEVAFTESMLPSDTTTSKNVSKTKDQDIPSTSTPVLQSSLGLEADPVNQKIKPVLQSQSSKAVPRDMEQRYKSDLELLKSSYDAQLELLRSSYVDLKSRAERDVDSVRESYSARIDVLRSSMQAQIQSKSVKEFDHQDEIKRLRNLHLQALEECRLDMDAKYNRLREVHAEEISSLKSSSYHQRNVESMMVKVDESTEKLQMLSAKYESAYNAMTRESETIALTNKQLVAVVQNQLAQQQRTTSDVHMQVQQTVSRLEGTISEMNRKFEEQHYAIQTSHGILQSAHAALQEERKQFMQQITLERDHLRKAHRELITMQAEFRQNVREDHAKLLLEARNLSSASERHEEVVTAASEQMAKRNQEYEKQFAQLNAERIECITKHAKIEAQKEKVNCQKEHLDEELKKFNKEKAVLQQIQSELESKQHEMNAISQKKRETEVNMEKVHDESRRFERERNDKLAGIHLQMEDLERQRQLLTEERQALAKERMATSNLLPMTEVGQPITPVKQRMGMSHPGSPDLGANSGLLLWQHASKKDHSFLEDEQFFLKTVGNSPFGKKSL